jgi:hypothetical protein
VSALQYLSCPLKICLLSLSCTGSPHGIVDLLQQMGRAGRLGQLSMAIVYAYARQLVDREKQYRAGQVTGAANAESQTAGPHSASPSASAARTTDGTNEEEDEVGEGSDGEEEVEEEAGDAVVPNQALHESSGKGGRTGTTSKKTKKHAVSSLSPILRNLYSPASAADSCYRRRMLLSVYSEVLPGDMSSSRCCNGAGCCAGYSSQRALLDALCLQQADIECKCSKRYKYRHLFFSSSHLVPLLSHISIRGF